MSERSAMNGVRTGPGRPPKYGRQSRAVALTLPEDVIDRLEAIDTDLGRAVVSMVERRSTTRIRTVPPAELASYGGHAIIVVTPVRTLKRLKGVELVPIGNGRALIALDHAHGVARLELQIRDAMEDAKVAPAERETLEAVSDILRRARSSRGVVLEERTIIVLGSKRRRRAPAARVAN